LKRGHEAGFQVSDRTINDGTLRRLVEGAHQFVADLTRDQLKNGNYPTLPKEKAEKEIEIELDPMNPMDLTSAIEEEQPEEETSSLRPRTRSTSGSIASQSKAAVVEPSRVPLDLKGCGRTKLQRGMKP
jgi:hypothetical protein